MIRLSRFLTMATVGLALTTTGCASMISKSDWPVTIQTYPTGAKCTIEKANGIQVQTGESPMTVVLEAGDGYFSSANYSYICKKDGYMPATRKISSTINGWYIANFIFIGGLIGGLFVDPATGAMYKLNSPTVLTLYADSNQGREDFIKAKSDSANKAIDTGDYDKAIAEITDAIKIVPNSADGYCIRSIAYFKMNEYEKSLTDSNKSISLDPKYFKAYGIRGECNLYIGNYEGAIIDANTAINLKKDFGEAYVVRALANLKLNKPSEAKADMQAACKLGSSLACDYDFQPDNHTTGSAF